MSSNDVTSNAGAAAIAYQDALNQARNMQNALLRQYGYTAPSATGEYTVEAAQRAFDPNTLFDKATGGIDRARLSEATRRLEAGGTGLIANIRGAGAASEAEAVLGSRAAGITGGLAAQRRRLAETQTSGELGAAGEQLLASFAEAQAPIGGAYRTLQFATAESKAQEEAAKALAGTMPTTPEEEDMSGAAETPTATPVFASGSNAAGGILSAGSRGKFKIKGTPQGRVPAEKPGQTFTGKGGVNWVYRPQGPSGAGWYKQAKGG